MSSVYMKKHRTAAVLRSKLRAERSPEQQLEVLDKRLGVGVGAKKERLKLKELMEKLKKVAADLEEAKKKEAEDQENKRLHKKKWKK